MRVAKLASEHAVSSNSVISSLCLFVFLFVRQSEPVYTRKAMTDARPIPPLGKMYVGEK